MLRILTSHHAMPNVKSYRTMFFENVLPALQAKTDVHIIWLVYMPHKISGIPEADENSTIIDIHDFNNAVEVIKKVKPDIIHASPNPNFMEYALALAGKFLGIPVVGEIVNVYVSHSSKMGMLKSYIMQFFQNSVPTDTSENQKSFMKRGIFFVYKYRFLLRTQKIIKMKISKIITDSFKFFTAYLSITEHLNEPWFGLDLYFVEGERLIEPLSNIGFDKSSLVLTGNPIFDPVCKDLQKWQKPTRKGNTTRVLLITNALYEHGVWTREQRDSMLKEVVTEICNHKDEMSLVVKIHPSTEILSEFQSLIKPIDPSIPIYQKGDVLEFLKEADVVIATVSATALVYSLLANKPIIICNFFNLENDVFLEQGLALECKEVSSLVSLIQQSYASKLIPQEKIDKFIRDYYFKFDGLSSERIANFMLVLVKNHKK